MKIGIILRSNIFNGSTRVRALQFVPYWESQGCIVNVLERELKTDVYHRLLFIKNIISLAIKSDVIFLQKPNLSKYLLKIIAFINKNIVVDFDDAVWNITPQNTGETALKISKEFGVRLKAAIKISKAVVAGSNYLANWAKTEVPESAVYVVPPSVDLGKYNFCNSLKDKKEEVIVGWIGSEGNMIDFKHLEGVFEQLSKKYNIRFLIVSSKSNSLLSDFYMFEEWSLETEAVSLNKIDIGIMPLLDDERSRGRCGYKAIQYMSLGIPVISSPVGGATEVVIDGFTGILAKTTEEWEEAIINLVKYPELRNKYGNNGRKRVEQLYNTEINSLVLLDVFKKLI